MKLLRGRDCVKKVRASVNLEGFGEIDDRQDVRITGY